MRVSVAGLWHLGTVTAACCAQGGHDVTAFDEDSRVIEELRKGPPSGGRTGAGGTHGSGGSIRPIALHQRASALADSEVLWICHDTPVDEDDTADIEFVYMRVRNLLPYLPPQALVLISSQLPVGSTAKLNEIRPELTFAYSPGKLAPGQSN